MIILFVIYIYIYIYIIHDSNMIILFVIALFNGSNVRKMTVVNVQQVNVINNFVLLMYLLNLNMMFICT